jgi:hypothetical protein
MPDSSLQTWGPLADVAEKQTGAPLKRLEETPDNFPLRLSSLNRPISDSVSYITTTFSARPLPYGEARENTLRGSPSRQPQEADEHLPVGEGGLTSTTCLVSAEAFPLHP